MKLLIDTNVYLDYLVQRQPFAEQAKKIVMAGFFDDAELWVSTQSICDAEYVLRRARITREQVRDILDSSLLLFRPCGTYAQDLKSVFEEQWPDTEDGLIAKSAKRIGADFIITRDAEGFRKSRVPVLTPTELLTKIKEEQRIVYDEVDLRLR